ncbi:MAG: hypothetical protein ACETVZ_00260 [Phycisphaerae bacterium]
MKEECFIVILLVVVALCLLVVGCEQAFRFAPSESIKQNTELTHSLAKKINEEGTTAKSPASGKMVQGTLVALTYTGRPKTPPDPEQFETITAQAQQEAEKRPEPWEMADAALNLGIGICSVFGGVYGLKGVRYLKQAKVKSKALQEIISGNELFKSQAGPQVNEAFAKAQDAAQKTNGTKRIVAEAKLT